MRDQERQRGERGQQEDDVEDLEQLLRHVRRVRDVEDQDEQGEMPDDEGDQKEPVNHHEGGPRDHWLGWDRGDFKARSEGGGQGTFDRLLEAIGAERFVKDGPKALLASLDDRVAGVVAEPGHQDDRHVGLDLAEPSVGLVAVEVGQADVNHRGGIGGLASQGNGLLGIASGFDGRP